MKVNIYTQGRLPYINYVNTDKPAVLDLHPDVCVLLRTHGVELYPVDHDPYVIAKKATQPAFDLAEIKEGMIKSTASTEDILSKVERLEVDIFEIKSKLESLASDSAKLITEELTSNPDIIKSIVPEEDKPKKRVYAESDPVTGLKYQTRIDGNGFTVYNWNDLIRMGADRLVDILVNDRHFEEGSPYYGTVAEPPIILRKKVYDSQDNSVK